MSISSQSDVDDSISGCLDLRLRVACIMGLPVHVINRDECLSVLSDFKKRNAKCFLTTPNVNFIVTAQVDPGFRDSICLSDVVVVDGMPLVWVARLLGLPLRERVSGADLFEDIANSEEYWRTFLMGGPEGAAEQACLRLKQVGGKIQPVGFFYPGFSSIDEMPSTEIVRAVRDARPDLFVVALGAVKGQAWICKHLTELPTCVVSHLGAVVNFAAGGVLRAPLWIQRSGLEWVWRIKEEPGLWRRYLHDGYSFIVFFLHKTFPLMFFLWAEKTFIFLKLIKHSEFKLINDPCFPNVIFISGDCVINKFNPLVHIIDKSMNQGKDISIDMSGVKLIDHYFAGFLMVMETKLRRSGSRLVLISIPRHVRRLFNWMGAGEILREK